jgi:hypothetical protein
MKTQKHDTTLALEAADRELAKAEADLKGATDVLAKLEGEFDSSPSEKLWPNITEARGEIELRSRIHGAAKRKFDAAQKAENDRVAAEVEAKRVADLAQANRDAEQNIVEARDLVAKLSVHYRRHADLQNLAATLGQSVIAHLGAQLNDAAINKLVDAGMWGTEMRFS